MVLSALRAMAKQMIGQNKRHHCFADRNRTNADAGIVAALGDDVRLMARRVDGVARRQDR